MGLVVVITCDVADCNERADCTWDNPPERGGPYPWGVWRPILGKLPSGWVDDGFTAPEGWQNFEGGRMVCPKHEIVEGLLYAGDAGRITARREEPVPTRPSPLKTGE